MEEEEENSEDEEEDKKEGSKLSKSLLLLATGKDVESQFMEESEDSRRREKIYSGLKWGR